MLASGLFVAGPARSSRGLGCPCLIGRAPLRNALRHHGLLSYRDR